VDKIEVRCPSCGKLLRAPVSAAGRNAKCPSCGQLMQLPAAPEVQAPTPGVPPVPMPPQQPVYDAEDVTSDPFAAPAPMPSASPFGGAAPGPAHTNCLSP
jgi:phage FluMu protein Com